MAFAEAAQSFGFEITEPPVRGGSGSVYRAIERSTGAAVALKLLAPGADVGRLQREAQILASIDHDHVARLRDFTVIDDTPVLILEWVDGVPLAEVLRGRRPIPQPRALGIFEQLSDALESVHRRGVVHRDLSPTNVLIDSFDHVTVIDFGVSRSVDTATVTIEGSVAGTPRYMAPEVIEGAEPTDRSDQYSAAIMLHELLAGAWPFPDVDAVGSAFHHQLHTAPKPLDEIDSSIEPGLADAVLRALEKDPADRFDSMAAFGNAVLYPKPPSIGELVVDRLLYRPLVSATAALAAVALAGFAIVQLGLVGWPPLGQPSQSAQPDQSLAARVTIEPWEPGLAEQLTCNLLAEADFEDETLPQNYYLDSENPERILVTVAPDGGVGGTGSLTIGVVDDYGLWGETIPVNAGRAYLFSANAQRSGLVGESAMSVAWLDADYAPIGESGELDILATGNGQLTLLTAPAPVEARFAVPRLYKDASPGLLSVDELVFAEADTGCDELLLGS